MATTASPVEVRERLKEEWLGRLDDLVSLVKRWSESAGWTTREDVKSVTEPSIGRFSVPLLFLERGGSELVLSPLARTTPAPEGTVDLCRMPGYDDVVSLRLESGGWFVEGVSSAVPAATAGGRRPLDPSAFLEVLDAAAESDA